MALPTSRLSLKEFCLRKLGKGVIQINVSDSQIDDRIDEAIRKIQEFHSDGTEKVYIAHKITPSIFSIVSTTGTFSGNEKIKGQTSEATGIFISLNGSAIEFQKLFGNFTAGETITGQAGGATAVLVNEDAVTLGDFDNGYVTVEDGIVAVTRLIKSDYGTGLSGEFSPFRDSFYREMYLKMGQGLTNFYITQQYQSMVQLIAADQISYRFNRFTKRLHIDADWNGLKINNYIVYEAEKIFDPNQHLAFYSDEFLIRYVTAHIQEQWGQNLIKFPGVELLSGTNLNAEKILSDAQQKLKDLEEELHLRYSDPIGFLMG